MDVANYKRQGERSCTMTSIMISRDVGWSPILAGLYKPAQKAKRRVGTYQQDEGEEGKKFPGCRRNVMRSGCTGMVGRVVDQISWRDEGQKSAKAAPAVQAIAQVEIGEKFTFFPSAALVFTWGDGAPSGFVSVSGS